MLAIPLSPTQSDAQAALRAFLLDVLPAGTEVFVGQGNRVPEPKVGGFAVITPLRFKRLATNFDQAVDVKYTGSISGSVLQVSRMLHGSIIVGCGLYGVGVASGTAINKQLTGAPGAEGTYQVSVAQTLASETLSSGYRRFVQNVDLAVQIDFHSADLSAGDMAEVVSTVFRSEYATDFFKQQNPAIFPLHADDPTERPFINDQQAYEWRWGLDCHVEVAQALAVPQQFADSVHVGLIEIDSHYPP